MGDPACFHIKHGANPHTRNRFGLRKKVDLVKATEQWQALKETLESYGVQVHVIPAHEEMPGLVFPANAGFVPKLDQPLPINEREFILSNLNVSRSPEQDVYANFVKQLGLKIHRVSKQFEGQADLIQWRDRYLFTYGVLQEPHCVPCLSVPPWKRIYGFRSDRGVLEDLQDWIPVEKTLTLELCDERFYHGDTLLYAIGSQRQYLLAYAKGLTRDSRKRLGEGPDIIELSDNDAQAYAANSFQVLYEGQCILFMPTGISEDLKRKVEEKGVRVVQVDVSEFKEKGGGSIKCMIGDLGQSE
jgi:N-dimethylarginine dimethylaminohydrolase